MQLLAAILCVGSVFALRLGWRGASTQSTLMTILGWCFLILGTIVWSIYYGWEYGLCFSLAIWSLSAWILVALGAQKRPSHQKESTQQARQVEAASKTESKQQPLARKVATFLIAGPLSLITCCLASIVIIQWLPLDRPDQLVVAAFLFPLLWSTMIFWSCVNNKKLINALSMATTSAGCAAWLFM